MTVRYQDNDDLTPGEKLLLSYYDMLRNRLKIVLIWCAVCTVITIASTMIAVLALTGVIG